MKNKKTILLVAIAIIVVLIGILMVVLLNSKTKDNSNNSKTSENKTKEVYAAYRGEITPEYNKECAKTANCVNQKSEYEIVLYTDKTYKYSDYATNVDSKDVYHSYQEGTYKLKDNVLTSVPKKFYYNDAEGDLTNLKGPQLKIKDEKADLGPNMGVTLTKVKVSDIKHIKI